MRYNQSSKVRAWFERNGGLGKWLYISGVCLVILVYMSMDSLHRKCELQRYGAVVYARMIGSHTSDSKVHTNMDDLVYQFNRTTYRAEIDDYEQHFRIGDTVILKCSTNDRSIYDMIGIRINGQDHQRTGE